MERGIFAALLAACGASLAGAVAVDVHAKAKAGHAGDRKISPPLEPPSHQHFFKSDYPVDLHPVPRDDWSHPFPIVQDSDEYDKDFVKDENSDDGEWKYQSEYDRLRGKLAQAKADEERARKLSNSKAKEVQAAKDAEADARAKAKAALEAKKAKERDAEGKLKDAEKGVDAVGNGPEGDAVGRATKEVEQETTDLEGCEKQLEEARAKLKALQEERKKAEAAEKERMEAADAAEEAQVARMKAEEELEGKVSKETEDYKKAHADYLHESKSLAELEKEFKAAEAKLRKFRRAGVDPDGGVYRTKEEKSGASAIAKPLAVLSAIAVVALGNAMA